MRITRPTTGDIVAGVSVALLALPQGLAYAELAGVPAQYGLYAAALPCLLAAFFASSPYLQTGPVAVTALLTFGALQGMAEPQTSEYLELAALLALFVGVIRLGFGILRLGKIANLLTDPLILGFTSGLWTGSMGEVCSIHHLFSRLQYPYEQLLPHSYLKARFVL